MKTRSFHDKGVAVTVSSDELAEWEMNYLENKLRSLVEWINHQRAVREGAVLAGEPADAILHDINPLGH